MQSIGRYHITREIGRGAMGVVYHAIDPAIGRPVAIKTVRLREVDGVHERIRLRERLFREARSAGALSHPGIVTVYDMDEVDGLAYIAMEFVDGLTLDQLLSQLGAIAPDRVPAILSEAAAALDYAHRKGIVHRDIKPSNLMIDSSGAVKITDFGIAKIAHWEGQTLTGGLIGTPNYMSPEQVQGRDTDGRSDQFSLAVVAYEILTGHRPFEGEQISTVVFKIVGEHPVPVQNVNATLTREIDKVLRRGLAKKPERRFPSCTAFAASLAAALANANTWRILPARVPPERASTLDTALVGGAYRPIRKPGPIPPHAQPNRPGHRSWLVPAVAALLLLLAVVGINSWRSGYSIRHPLQADSGDPSSFNGPWDGLLPPALFPRIHKPAASRNRAPQEVPAAAPRRSAALRDAAFHGSSGSGVLAPSVLSPPRPSLERTVPEHDSDPAPTQQLEIATDPSGARAVIDGDRDSTCETPCRLPVGSGVHSLTITRHGYQPESREITVARQDIEYPLITLRSAAGILLLTSEPSAAHVWLDGHLTALLTPARIALPPGSHSVAIQKDDLESSDQVDIENGALRTLKLSVHRE